MPISDGLLKEFDREMATTRKTLERIPEDKLTWKPHDKSMPLGRLAGHIAELPGLGAMAVTTDAFDFATVRDTMKPTIAESRAHVLGVFDKTTAKAREAIANTDDAKWGANWKLSSGDQVFYNGPRIGAIRGMMLNHIIHHRGQLSVYLRLNDVPVPSIYGPSADEK
jgi:uncharacterized damage-inducible protein DinB